MNVWKQVAWILGCALAAGGASAVFHPKRPPWHEVEDPAEARWTIDPEKAGGLLAAGPVVWIDARSRKAYEAGHVPGALLLNAEEWGELMFEHQFALQEAFQRPVIVYCDGASCERSREIAQRLRELLGLDPVFVLKGDWRGFGAAP